MLPIFQSEVLIIFNLRDILIHVEYSVRIMPVLTHRDRESLHTGRLHHPRHQRTGARRVRQRHHPGHQGKRVTTGRAITTNGHHSVMLSKAKQGRNSTGLENRELQFRYCTGKRAPCNHWMLAGEVQIREPQDLEIH